MTKTLESKSRWKTFQVIHKDEVQTTPAEDVLAGSGTLPTTAVTKSRLLREIGWPDARTALIDDRGRHLIVRPDRLQPAIWELKCKPSCWRLYFYVYENNGRIVFLHATCKKKTQQDSSDARAARQEFDRLRAGRSAITAFPLEDEGAAAEPRVPVVAG